MKSTSIGPCTIAGFILVTLKLCGQLNSVPWIIVLIPWIAEIVLTLVCFLYFVKKGKDELFKKDASDELLERAMKLGENHDKDSC